MGGGGVGGVGGLGTVGYLEGDGGVVGGDDAGEEREGHVLQLHDHAAQSSHRRMDVEQVEDDLKERMACVTNGENGV